MEISVVLYEDERAEMINFHKRKVEKLRIEIKELNNELGKSLTRLAELANGEIFDLLVDQKLDSIGTASAAFEKGMPLWKKAEWVLAEYRTACNTRKIAEMILEKEEGILNHAIISDIVSALGATLLPKVNKGDTFNRQLVKGEYLYGLKNWWNEDGEIDVLFL